MMTVEEMSIGEYMNKDISVTDYTVDGKCSHCGGCCSNYLHIGQSDLKRIHEYLQNHKVMNHRFRNYGLDCTCPFLTDGGSCQIYEVRPSICREFICSRSQKEVDRNAKRYKSRFPMISMRQEFFGEEFLNGINLDVR